MNIKIKFILLFLIFNFIAIQTYAEGNNAENEILIELQPTENNQIKINNSSKTIEGHLFGTSDDSLKKAYELQKEIDSADIKLLWDEAIARNPVIKFALTKLSTSPDKRRIHSSLMSKSVSALINGAAILPGLFGADTLTSSAANAGGKLASRVITERSLPRELPLSDTEVIHLAELIDELQNKIIENYYEYKSSLEALRVCKQNVAIYNKNYSDALKSKNNISIIAMSALYDKELLNELKLIQKAKLSRLELERLSGEEAVSKLTLVVPSNSLNN